MLSDLTWKLCKFSWDFFFQYLSHLNFEKINFYWSIVALQCCVSFSCTATWISYTYIPSFLDILPIWVTREHLVGFPGSSAGEESACKAGDPSLIPGLGRSPGRGHGNHSSILAWRIPGTEEPGGLLSTGLQRVGHDWATKHSPAQSIE